MNRDRKTSQECRIAHITTVHQPLDPRIFYKQLGSLQSAGFDAHLIAPHDRSEDVGGVTIHALPRPQNRVHRLALQPRAYRMARTLDADLYQLHDPELLPLGYLLRKSAGSQIVYDMHENYRTKGPLLGRMLRALERWGFRWVDHVLIAEKSYRSVVADTSVSSTYIPNYVLPIEEESGDGELSRTEREEDRSVPTRLLYTGTLSTDRGLRTMVQLAAQIRRTGRPEIIEMAGVCRHEEQRTWAEDRIQAGDLGDIIVRVGWDTYVRPAALPPHYRRADVGLALFEAHANYVESVPTKFYEYLHYGLPIICSNFPLWRRFIRENECGAVVPPGDPEAVLEVIDRWHSSPERYRRCAQSARAAASQYRWEPVGKRLVDLYRDLLDGPTPADGA